MDRGTLKEKTPSKVKNSNLRVKYQVTNSSHLGVKMIGSPIIYQS